MERDAQKAFNQGQGAVAPRAQVLAIGGVSRSPEYLLAPVVYA